MPGLDRLRELHPNGNLEKAQLAEILKDIDRGLWTDDRLEALFAVLPDPVSIDELLAFDNEAPISSGIPVYKKQLKEQDTAVRMFGRMDCDQSGRIDIAEVREFVKSHKLGFTTEQVDAMVKVWDKDGSGYIDTAEFQDMMRASHLARSSVTISVIIPSTSDVDMQGTEEQLSKRRDRAMEFFAHRFGGCSANAAHFGAYEASNGDMVYEEGIKVTTFATPHQWEAQQDDVRKEVQKWCKEWSQECMALQVKGTVEFITPEDADPEALCRSFITRMKLMDQIALL